MRETLNSKLPVSFPHFQVRRPLHMTSAPMEAEHYCLACKGTMEAGSAVFSCFRLAEEVTVFISPFEVSFGTDTAHICSYSGVSCSSQMWISEHCEFSLVDGTL